MVSVDAKHHVYFTLPPLGEKPATRTLGSYLHVCEVSSFVGKHINPGDDRDKDRVEIAAQISQYLVLVEQRLGFVVRESVSQGQFHVVQTGSRAALWDVDVGPVGGEESQRHQAGIADVWHRGDGEFGVEGDVTVYADL